MQQTTCGEIHKIKVLDRSKVEDFIRDQKQLYFNLDSGKTCLYQEEKLVSDVALNYLNVFSGDESKEQLKILLKKEFTECESIYPFLGDYFINQYFSQESFECDNFLLNKENSNDFCESLLFENNKAIAKFVFEKASLEYGVSVQKSLLKDIHLEKMDKLNFDLDYDTSFLGSMNNHTMKNYKFLIVDGQIESIGEIHHLLDQAYKTKVPHVIFCFGMSDEVEHVIKYNNTHGKFELFPVIVKFDEKTINFLNDIAVLHRSNIVSSRSGQTISQAAREDLPEGIEITFHKKGFKIIPVATEQELSRHRNFLKSRILEAGHDESRKLIIDRLKRFSSKSIKLYLPEKCYENNDFLREVDYILRFLKNSKKVFCQFNFNNRKYYVPRDLLDIVDTKVTSLKSIYSNIEKMVIHARF